MSASSDSEARRLAIAKVLQTRRFPKKPTPLDHADETPDEARRRTFREGASDLGIAVDFVAITRMLSATNARALAERLLENCVTVFEYDFAMLTKAIQDVPEAFLGILEQRDVRFYPLNIEQRIDDVSPTYARYLEHAYPDREFCNESVDKLLALYRQ